MNRPSLDLSSVPLPTEVKLNGQHLAVGDLTDQQRKVLVDVARIDKEIADTEFSLRVLKSSKVELTRLLSSMSRDVDSADNASLSASAN